MKETITYKIKQLANKAKERNTKEVKVTLVSGNSTSLNDAIKSKEDGDIFMKLLKAL